MVESAVLCKTYEKTRVLEGTYSGGGDITVFGEDFIVSKWGDEIKWTNYNTSDSLFSMQASDQIYSFDIEQTRRDPLLALVDKSCTIQLFDTSSGSLVKSFKVIAGDFRSVAKILKWYIKGDLLVVGFSDGSLRLYAKDGYITHDFRAGHGGMITSIAMPELGSDMEDSWILVTGAADGSVCVWDLLEKKLINKFHRAHASAVTVIQPFENGKYWITAGKDSVVRLWTGRSFYAAAAESKGKDESICVKPVLDHFASVISIVCNDDDDGSKATFFICGGSDKMRLSMWKYRADDISEFTKVDLAASNQDLDANVQFSSPIEKLQWVDEGSGVFMVALADTSIFFYKIQVNANGRPVSVSRTKTIFGNYLEMTDAMFVRSSETSANDRILVSSNDEHLRLWNRSDNNWTLIPGHKEMILCLASSPIVNLKDFCFIASGSKDSTVRIYRSDTFECLAEGIGHTSAVNSIAFHRKGNEYFLVSVSDDRTMKLWSLKTLLACLKDGASKKIRKALVPLECTYTVHAHEKDIHCVDVAPNSAIIATCSQDKTAKIWNRADGSLKATLKGHKRGVWCVQFSPVDRVVATSSTDCRIKIWSCHDFSCLKTFEGHESSVLRVKFINKGLQLASVSSDGLLKLWNMKSSECMNTFDAHDDKIWGFDVQGDGAEFLTASTDCTITLWQDVTAAIKQETTEKRNLELLEEQDLMNEERLGNYSKALLLSFRLEKPQSMFRILDKIVMQMRDQKAFDECLMGLFVKELEGNAQNMKKLFYFILNWNSGSFKTSIIAQRCLFFLLQRKTPQQLVHMLSTKTTDDDDAKADNDDDLMDLLDVGGSRSGSRGSRGKKNHAARGYRKYFDDKIPEVVTMLKGIHSYTKRHLEHLEGDLAETAALLKFFNSAQI